MHFSIMEVTFVPLGVEDYLSKRIYLASIIRVFNKNEVLGGGRIFVFFLLL